MTTELEKEVARLQTELAYAVTANTTILETHHQRVEELLEEVEVLTGSKAGLSIENSELRVYVHELETCVAAARAGNASEGLKTLDEWLRAKKRRAA